jgi:hypothetical protein
MPALTLTALAAGGLCARRSTQLRLLHAWLDNWSGIGLIIAGMTHQGLGVQLTAYAARDWRANFFPVGIALHRRRLGGGSRRRGERP